MTKFEKLQQNSDIKGEVMETPRTDKAAFPVNLYGSGYAVVVNADFARQLERANNNLRSLCRELELENEILRNLLDKASQALACFVDLRGMSASELKSAHNGICILLDATKMLDAIKAGVEKDG